MGRATPQGARARDGRFLRESLAESARLDPLVTAGWKAMALLSLGIVGFIAATGYVACLILFSDRSRVKSDRVRSLALDHRQVIGLLAVEHVVIVIVGIGLGAWAGLHMSALTVDLLARTHPGGAAVPPILTSMDWPLVAGVCSALAFTFTVTLFIPMRRIFRSDLRSLSRMEGRASCSLCLASSHCVVWRVCSASPAGGPCPLRSSAAGRPG